MMTGNLGSIAASLHADFKPEADEVDEAPKPFVTIARQAGAGGHTLAENLVQRLGRDWKTYDRELIEQVAQDHQVSPLLLESITDEKVTWLREVFGGRPSEISLYHKVAVAIHGLAHTGNAVIVGRGGVFITQHMPAAVHVYLVAPVKHRIEHLAGYLNFSRSQSERKVREIEANRAAFYRRYFPKQQLSPENFTITLNTSVLTDDQIGDAVMPLIEAHAQQPTWRQTHLFHGRILTCAAHHVV